MARIESWYKQDLKKPVPIRRMETVFNQDALGHLFGVEVYSDGQAVTLTGSVTGYCLLADGTTVPVSGTRSANKASIVIPQTAYSVIGPITITVKLTEGSAITTLLAVVGMVARSRTGQQVNPGSTITDWTNQISAQLQAVQTAADNLGSTLAAPFSTATAYTAGAYVMYNGSLYRFTNDHAAGDWSSSDVAQVKACNEISDLKSALNEVYDSTSFVNDFTESIIDGKRIATNGDIGTVVSLTPADNASYGYIIIDCFPGDTFTVTGTGGEVPRLWAFIDSDNKLLASSGINAALSNSTVTAVASATKAIFNVLLSANHRIIYNNSHLKIETLIDAIEDALVENVALTRNNTDGLTNVFETASDYLDITNEIHDTAIYLSGGIGNIVDLTERDSETFGHYLFPCYPGQNVIITGTGGGNPRLYGFIDAQDKLLAVADAYENGLNKVVTAPNGTAKCIINVEKESLHKIVTKALLISPNLFDYKTITKNKKIDNTTGEISADTSKSISDFIPVKPGVKYTFMSMYGYINYYDQNKAWQSARQIYGYYQETVTIPIPDGIYYVRFSLNNNYWPFQYSQYVEGETPTKDLRVGGLIPQERIKKQKEIMFSDMPIPTQYSAIGTEAVDGTALFDDDDPSVEAVYAAYDELLEAYPTYITKEDLGLDQSNQYHLFAYYFNPESMQTDYSALRLAYPKINLGCGIHGNGESGDSNINLFCTYYFFKSLCENWRASEALSYLRWNVRFAIIPIQNPWGFQNKKRVNSRGVDINRNFSVGWEQGTSGQPAYGGASAMSEAETNIIAAFEKNNSDAIISIDIHSNGGVPEQNQMCYTSAPMTGETFYVAKSLVTMMSHVWDEQNIPGLNKMNFHGFVATPFNGWGARTTYVKTIVGTDALTLEGFKNFNGSEYNDDSAEIVKMVADQLGYCVLTALRHYGKW